MATQTHTHNTMFVGWLNDAYAMEQGIVEALESQVKLAKDHPMVKDGIQRHLEATKGHAESVKGCLDQLGESPSKVKSGIAELGSKVQSITMGAADDKLVKAALNDYATEHMEIASYRALITAADQLGHPEIARICQGILQDEIDMAAWLDENLPMLVRETLTKSES
jgi:ferritin-like metal-binding protein YciE